MLNDIIYVLQLLGSSILAYSVFHMAFYLIPPIVIYFSPGGLIHKYLFKSSKTNSGKNMFLGCLINRKATYLNPLIKHEVAESYNKKPILRYFKMRFNDKLRREDDLLGAAIEIEQWTRDYPNGDESYDSEESYRLNKARSLANKYPAFYENDISKEKVTRLLLDKKQVAVDWLNSSKADRYWQLNKKE